MIYLNGWAISGIVLAIVFFVVLPSIVFTISGFIFKKILKKTPEGTNFVDALNGKMDISFYNNGPMRKLTEKGRDYMEHHLFEEDVYVTSYDKLKLHGYFYRNPLYPDSKRFFIGFHGFKSGPRDEYAPYIEDYIKLGFNILVVDERAHHKSEGKYITMGAKEQNDVISWLYYVVKRFGEDSRILIQGVSMGAASVTLASALNVPKQLIGIISDCAYTSPYEELKYQMHNFAKGVPTGLFVPFLSFFLRVSAGINFKKADGLDAVSHANVPILFFHGRKDQMVPVEFANQLYEACSSRKKLVIVDEANHGESYGWQNKLYMDTIVEFFSLDQDETKNPLIDND